MLKWRNDGQTSVIFIYGVLCCTATVMPKMDAQSLWANCTCYGRSTSKNGSLVRNSVIEINESKLLERGQGLLLTSSVEQSPHWKYWVKNPDSPPEITLAISRHITNRRTEYRLVNLDRKNITSGNLSIT